MHSPLQRAHLGDLSASDQLTSGVFAYCNRLTSVKFSNRLRRIESMRLYAAIVSLPSFFRLGCRIGKEELRESSVMGAHERQTLRC